VSVSLSHNANPAFHANLIFVNDMPKRPRSLSPFATLLVCVAVVIATQTCVIAAAIEEDDPPLPRSQWWEETGVHLPEDRFKLWFRVPQVVFNAVLERIKDHPVFKIPYNVGSRSLTVAKQLAAFLMRLGFRRGNTGKVADLMGEFAAPSPPPLPSPSCRYTHRR